MILLRNSYFKNIYRVIGKKLIDYVDEGESNNLTLSSMSLVPLFKDQFGKKHNFRTYYLSSLTRDITTSKNWGWYRCYSSPCESFHVNIEKKTMTCGSCYLKDNPEGLYDDDWNPKDGIVTHLTTKKRLKNNCDKCKKKVAKFKFVRDCFECRYELFTKKEELIEKGYVKTCLWLN